MNQNIVLIGMPGSGKSTVGRRLASALDMSFIDTDGLLEKAAKTSIQNLVDGRGIHFFRHLEEQVLCDLQLKNHIISTGGSAVYSQAAMQHLSTNGLTICLKISKKTMLAGVNNLDSRGIVKMRSHPLVRLYNERAALYEQAADLTFDNDRPLTALNLNALLQQISNR